MATVMLGSPFAPLDFKRLHRHAGAAYDINQHIQKLSVHRDCPMAGPNSNDDSSEAETLSSDSDTQNGSTDSDMTAVNDSSDDQTSTEEDRPLLEVSGHKRPTSAREGSRLPKGEPPYRRHPSASEAVAKWTKQVSLKVTDIRAAAKTHHLTQPNLLIHDSASASPSTKTKTRSIQPKYYIIARPSQAYAKATPVIAKSLRQNRITDMLGQAEPARRPSLVSGLLAYRFSSSLQLHPPSQAVPPHSPPLSESGFSDHSLFSDHSSGSSATTMSIPPTSSDDDYMHGHSNLKHVGMLSFQKPAAGQTAAQNSMNRSYNVFVAPRLVKASTCPVGPYTIPISKHNRRSLSINTNVSGDPASGPIRSTRTSRAVREVDTNVPETPEPVSPPPFPSPSRPSLSSLVIPSRRSSAPAIAIKPAEADQEAEYLPAMEEEEDDLDFCCRGSDSPLPARLAFPLSTEVPSELGLRRGKPLQALNLN